jgi:hypothetical protein
MCIICSDYWIIAALGYADPYFEKQKYVKYAL